MSSVFWRRKSENPGCVSIDAEEVSYGTVYGVLLYSTFATKAFSLVPIVPIY